MNPIAFEIFNLEIRWYGILMALAMLLGTMLMLRQAKKYDIKENDLYDLILVVLPSAVVGARLYYVAFNWEYYQWDFLKIINTRGGGMAIHGGIIFGLLSGYLFCKRRGLKFWQLADMAAPGLVLGQAIGRWGNFMNNEAHGGPTDLPWGIMVDGAKVHPTFLYESVWNLLVFAFIWKYKDRKKHNGEVIMIYLGLYSFGRFFIEGLRTDSLMLGSLRMAQVISIAIIISSIIGFKLIRKYSKD
ncbi:MAG: prolipoprotein diacylglyceryl transferase [Acidaminobacteraceae bacterium]